MFGVLVFCSTQCFLGIVTFYLSLSLSLSESLSVCLCVWLKHCSYVYKHYLTFAHVDSRVERIDLLRFLAGCHKRR